MNFFVPKLNIIIINYLIAADFIPSCIGSAHLGFYLITEVENSAVNLSPTYKIVVTIVTFSLKMVGVGENLIIIIVMFVMFVLFDCFIYDYGKCK